MLLLLARGAAAQVSRAGCDRRGLAAGRGRPARTWVRSRPPRPGVAAAHGRAVPRCARRCLTSKDDTRCLAGDPVAPAEVFANGRAHRTPRPPTHAPRTEALGAGGMKWSRTKIPGDRRSASSHGSNAAKLGGEVKLHCGGLPTPSATGCRSSSRRGAPRPRIARQHRTQDAHDGVALR